MNQIPIAKPLIEREEIRAVVKVMKSGELAQGRQVVKFEQDFSRLVQDRECVAVNSGTSALQLCLLSLGIGPGDEVIVPSFTFAATANSVCLVGAHPIFVDIDPTTYNLDPRLIENAITSRTKAIQVVHLYGLPADMKSIMTIAEKHKLLVIEDAAQAHMASIDGKPVGTFGDAAAFSFYPTKNMTSGEGGMIVVKDSGPARLSRLYRNQGMEQRYQNEVIGFNMRMTEIHAAIGISQLQKLSQWTQTRQENAMYLSSKIEGLATPSIPDGYSHSFHQYTIRVARHRALFSETLSSFGIGNSIYYPTPVHKLPSFNSKLKLKHTEAATEQVLSIPVHPSLTKKELKRIADGVNRARELTGA